MTPGRFAKGMTFDEYVAYLGSPQNLEREGLFGAPRRDLSIFFRKAYETTRLSEPQVEAIRWLAAQPHGPGKILVTASSGATFAPREGARLQSRPKRASIMSFPPCRPRPSSASGPTPRSTRSSALCIGSLLGTA